jgi:hypothetical protein
MTIMSTIDLLREKIDTIEMMIEKNAYELKRVRGVLDYMENSRTQKEVDIDLELELYSDEAKDALENIEQEIIARACRNGVCED